MKQLFIFLFALLCLLPESGQGRDCDGLRYKEKIFPQIELINEVVYARKQTSSGQWQNLAYDVYLPIGDEATDRPAVMLAHGGGYIDFIDQKSPDIVKMAKDLAKRGYVVFSVEYREESNPLSLFSEENMVKAVGRALIDIRDATCSLMDTTLNHGNPYGVDPETVIIGGVSAGAVSFLHAVYLDSLSWLPQHYQDWILEVEPNTQALLDDRYCGANVVGLVSISGALLDTSWMQASRVEDYPAMYHVHGTADPIVPYEIDHPFGLTTLPQLMGSSPIHARAQSLGIRSEIDVHHDAGHVPIFGINLEGLFSEDPIDLIFNQGILGATLRHTAEFCYSLLGCESDGIILSQNDATQATLNTWPNPSAGDFKISLPAEYLQHNSYIEIINTVGQSVYHREISPMETTVIVDQDLQPGMYHIVLNVGDSNIQPATGQVMVLH